MDGATPTAPDLDGWIMLQEIVDTARTLTPLLKERARAGEIAREVPEATIQDLIKSGVLRTIVPKRYGGHQADWDTILDMLMELGRGDGSQAWVSAVFTVHAFDVAMFSEQAQQELWGTTPDTLVVSGVAPSGKGERRDGGVMVSGHWSFASGVRHAHWGELGVMIEDAETGKPAHHLCLVPASDWKIEDRWEVMGLMGTGSNDIHIEECFVPDHRIITRVQQREGTAPGTAGHDDPIYATPYLTIGPTALSAVVVGSALGALDEFIAFTKARQQRGNPVAERESMQLRIAESAAEVDCARMLLIRLAETASVNMREDGMLSVEERARARRDTAYACTLSKRAVERLFEASGAHGIYLNEHFQRYYRDVKAGSNHIAIGWDRCGATYGRVALGLEPGVDEI